MTPTPDGRITESWNENAARWTAAVRSGAIRSRAAGTDAAIVAAVRRLDPEAVLDLGCGEGWLVRELRGPRCRMTGVDGSADLIGHARAADPAGDYRCIGYDAIAANPAVLDGPYDAIVANFALLSEPIGGLLHALLAAAPNGALVIQTVHPFTACGDAPYRDGWREESFAAFGGESWRAMPWFFRTVGSWQRDLREAGWRIDALDEPVDPQGGRPLSLLMTCAPRG